MEMIKINDSKIVCIDNKHFTVGVTLSYFLTLRHGNVICNSIWEFEPVILLFSTRFNF